MAVMMVIMVVVLVALGPGHHFGSHDSHASPGQETQSHQHDTTGQENAPAGSN